MASEYLEKDLWRDFKLGMVGVARANTAKFDRHEDRVTPGTPDVSYTIKVSDDLDVHTPLPIGISGWVELKVGQTRSPGAMDLVPVWAKFEPGQLPWLHDRAKLGGLAHVLLRFAFVQHHTAAWVLVPGQHAEALTEKLTIGSLAMLSGVHIYWGESLSPLQWGDILLHLAGG